MAELQLTRDGNAALALFHGDGEPRVGDVLTCDQFDPVRPTIDDDPVARPVTQHTVHYVVQRRAGADGKIESVLSLEAGTTITVASPAE